MLRHILIAAWRNMAANRLISAIAILGLAVGIAVALLSTLVIRNQLSYDHFIPGYERTYVCVSAITLPGRPAIYSLLAGTTAKNGRAMAPLLKLNVPEIDGVTLLAPTKATPDSRGEVVMEHGNVTGREEIYWAEPNLSDVLPLPVFRGDLKTALSQPDGMILTRGVAEKYFGRDDVVGRILSLNGHPMTVRAVIENYPANATELAFGIFASSLAPFSGFRDDSGAAVQLYVRLKPTASIDAVQRQIPALLQRQGWSEDYVLSLQRLDRLQLSEGLYPGNRIRLVVTGLIGLLILFVSAVNFVNLMTARAARRAREVGIRKACGSGRSILVAQFLGEAILAVALATGIALVASEWLLPKVNAFLATGARLEYWRDLPLAATLLLGVGLLGAAAGAYPAFVLSAFKPVRALKGSPLESGNSMVRNVLTGLQFAILVVLAIAAIVVWQQRTFATKESLRANIDRMVMVRDACQPAFRAELRKLPGVAGVSCSTMSFLTNRGHIPIQRNGARVTLAFMSADWGIFALYGIQPIAGSLASTSLTGDYSPGGPSSVVLNAAAARALGFASPRAAIGQRAGPSRVIAVVPDFAFTSVEKQLEPTAYFGGPNAMFGALTNIKLKGSQIPETLAAIDRLWTSTGNSGPIGRFFLTGYVQQQYLGLMRQTQLLSGLSVLAVLLSCLGLFALSVSSAEQRTKEIGIRKAMGAGDGQIVALLLWQFAQPVLWANVIAWPAAWWLMRRWLAGFAYHIDLHWWVFAGASLGALAIALATVAGQAFLTARQKPVLALRYE